MQVQESPLQKQVAPIHGDQEQEGQEFEGQEGSLLTAEGEDAAQMRKIQSAANNSPQVRQLKAIQRAVSQSFQVQHSAQLKAAAKQFSGEPIQRQVPEVKNNTGLPDQLKSGMEDLSGMSLDDVKVHYNSSQPAQVGAHAYAQGSDIHMAPGQEQHLAHEAWHVVQQKQGRVAPTMQMKGLPVNDDAGLEHEADRMGAKALQLRVNPEAKNLQRKEIGTRILQGLFANTVVAANKGTEFGTLSTAEFALNDDINVLLADFQDNPTPANHQAMMIQIEAKRQAIKTKHDALVLIVDDYEGSGVAEQKAFFDAYLNDRGGPFGGNPTTGQPDMNYDQIRALFNSLRAKTRATNDVYSGNALIAERSHFLMFVMQSLHDDMGVDQYRTLDNNLGPGRHIDIGRVASNLQAGLVNPGDDVHARKTDNGGNALDPTHLANGGNTGLGFLQQRFTAPYPRTPSGNQGMIGDVQVNMDRDNELMPIFTGVDNGAMSLFTGPKKMTVHHEVGHLNSMLEGVSGGGQGMVLPQLGNLTDQEEMFNIWGGPRSDRAYGEQLGLPQRFDHSSYLSYDGGHHGMGHQDFVNVMRSGIAFTSSDHDVTVMITTELRRLVDSSWWNITKGLRFKPKGVYAIRDVLENAPGGAVDFNTLRVCATTQDQRVDRDRHAFTTWFYQTLAGFNPPNKQALINFYLDLKQRTVPTA